MPQQLSHFIYTIKEYETEEFLRHMELAIPTYSQKAIINQMFDANYSDERINEYITYNLTNFRSEHHSAVENMALMRCVGFLSSSCTKMIIQRIKESGREYPLLIETLVSHIKESPYLPYDIVFTFGTILNLAKITNFSLNEKLLYIMIKDDGKASTRLKQYQQQVGMTKDDIELLYSILIRDKTKIPFDNDYDRSYNRFKESNPNIRTIEYYENRMKLLGLFKT